MSLLWSTLLLASFLLSPIVCYPYYDPRIRDGGDWQEAVVWAQPPARPEYEPSYGYPDYGDYQDQRPSYSEMDILRDQLAHGDPPFDKRLPPVDMPPVWEPVPQPLPGTWYDREVPVQNQVQENERLKELTEILMETLAQQIEEGRERSRLAASAARLDQSPEEDEDPVVEQLREASVKKAVSMSTQTPISTTDSPPTTEPPTQKQGQKEQPMLRPNNNRRPKFASRINRDKDARLAGYAARVPRQENRRQLKPFVNREDDLTQELDNLKKKSH